jgi:hypothetical protein
MNTNMSGMSPAGNARFQMMVAKLNGDMIFFFGTLSNLSRY